MDSQYGMASRFCYYNRQDEQKRRATMHINRKPGEQIEVDWAGDPAQITDSDTCGIIPARIWAPKDKPNVEGSVGVISTWITTALRNEQFFSLAELNKDIRRKLKEFVNRPFRRMEQHQKKGENPDAEKRLLIDTGGRC